LQELVLIGDINRLNQMQERKKERILNEISQKWTEIEDLSAKKATMSVSSHNKVEDQFSTSPVKHFLRLLMTY